MFRDTLYRMAMATVLVLFSSTVVADIVITGTRFVYPEKEKEVTVKIDNVGKTPALVQVWIDDGNPDATPETARAPFTLTPPINRIDGGKGQTLRIMYTGETLPLDKESLFWLNVLEIPASRKDKNNQLQLAVRSRLKIFFRPQGLPGIANEAGKSVTWKKVSGGIEGYNPTPYFVSVARITQDKEGKVPVADGGMIAPGGKSLFRTNKCAATIHPAYISDEGGTEPLAQRVAP
ncbi:TPA: molecular chaperone [Klebsiella oxytoca]|uniref:fimbrial biogenesis chaperone n=1 Tax=Klebsiella oxytoca TaxID=571 RepID=UPI00115ABE98|nr:fimbria/pilus periplasmic chaperone [Klebsiella oxytoca]HBV8970905.1 fimbria/pilus periplasmic chaperone [Klebsiella oxytoca]